MRRKARRPGMVDLPAFMLPALLFVAMIDACYYRFWIGI